MLKILNITLNIIILLIIFNQLILLTKFAYDYNFIYDYGSKMNEICTSESVEYETNRYQLNKNINNIEISNLNDNIILIISIIFTIAISVIFTFIFYNEFCNIEKNFMTYTLLSKVYIILTVLITFSILLYPILLIIFKLFNFKYNNIISLYNHDINKKNLYITLGLFCMLIIFRFITINNNYNIPDFKIIDENKNTKFIELTYFVFYAFIYLGVIYYITNILILYMYKKNNMIVDKNEFSDNKNLISQYINKLFGISEHYKYIEKIEYKSTVNLDANKIIVTKNDNLPKNLNNYNNIPEETINNIITNIKVLLNQNDIFNQIEETEKAKIDTLIIKSIKHYIIIKYNNNNNNNTDNNKYETELYKLITDNPYLHQYGTNKTLIASIIVQKITKSIDELNMEIINNNKITTNPIIAKKDNNEIYISDKKSIFRKNIQGLLFIIGILLLSIFIVNIVISYYNYNIGNRIKNNIIIPLLSLYVIILILISNNTFNKMINHYIINNPKISYKNNIKNINFNFNKILENEFYIYENTNNTLCKNAATSFISVINNVLFYKSIILKDNSENIVIEFPSELKNYETENITSICNNNVDNNNYNFKTNFSGVFYNEYDCSILFYNNIKSLIKNTVIFTIDSNNNSELNNLLNDIKNIKYDNNIANTILYDIIYTQKKYENIKILLIKTKEYLRNLLMNTLYNTIILKKSYNNKDIANKNDIIYLTPIEFKNNINAINSNSEIKKYKYIVDNIVDEFINMIIINQYLLSKIIDKNNNLSEIIEKDDNTINDNFNLKKKLTEYINNFIKLYESYLNKLDLIFKHKYNLNKKTNQISLYLINIYNNLNEDYPYYDDIIYPYNKKNEDNISNKNLLNDFNKKLANIIDDYDKLRIICNNKNRYNNNECDIENTNYDKKVLYKEIENTIRTNNLNINNYLIFINSDILTNIEFVDYVNSNYNKNDAALAEYQTFTDIISKVQEKILIISTEYKNILDPYYNLPESADVFNSDVKETIFNMFYNKNRQGTLKSKYDKLVIIKNIINYLLKIIDNKKDEKNYQEKEDILNINTKIKEVNYIFICLIIIYLFILYLIKYIK